MWTKLPWWSGFPISLGMGVMGVFAPSVMPDWWQKVFFFGGAAFFGWGVIAALWHFGLGAWLKRNVLWRFRLRQPINPPLHDLERINAEYEAAKESGRLVTAVDRERFAETWCAVHDFIGKELRPFLGRLYAANTGSGMIQALPALQAEQKTLAGRAGLIWHAHTHYLSKMDLDIQPLMRALEAMRNPMGNALEAKDWPQPAQVEKTRAITTCIAHLNDAVNLLSNELPDRREKFIDR